MINSDLIRFIKEARKRGFEDYEIRIPLVKEGWPKSDIELAFKEIDKKQYSGGKIRLVINLNNKIYSVINKRAKKNLLSVEEQIEDIVRHSASTTKIRKPGNEKIDDLLVAIFSRKKKK